MCKKTLFLTSLVLVLGLVGSVSATTFYVDPVSGSMENNGSSGSPWSTLEAVFDNNKIETKDKNGNPKNSGAPVKAGDTLLLLSGYHGDIYESVYFNDDYITIEAKSGHTPELKRFRLSGGKKWILRGLDISPSNAVTFERVTIVEFYSRTADGICSDMIVEDCNIYTLADSSGWTANDWDTKACTGITLGMDGGTGLIARNNYLLNVSFGINLEATGALGEGNIIENFSGDGIRATYHYATAQYNLIKNCYAVNDNHDDGIQTFLVNVGMGDVNGIKLIGNIVINNTDPDQPYRGTLEGLGNFAGPYDNFVIENNLILVDHWHGIALYNSQNGKIVNNTVFNKWYYDYDSNMNSWILITEGSTNGGNLVRNNIAHSFDTSGDSSATVDNNLTFSRTSDDPADWFVNYSNFNMHTDSSSSPQVDDGSSSQAPDDDIEGTSRPQGSYYDIGAYEYTSGGDTTAPSPDPMTWSTDPYATGTTSISMTATTATDSSGVEYYFDCTAGGGNDSGWQDSTTYQDTGLSELTQYTYRVKARDKSANQNETGYSTTKSATTQDGTAPSPDPMTWSTDPYATGTTSISMTATTATDASGVEYYFDCTAGGGNDSGWQDSATYEDTGLSASTQYTYRVQARDKSSNQNATSYSTTKSATTDAEAGPELVSWWKLDESSGTNADDSSGNNHDGTRTGGSWAPTGGKFDGAVDIGDANSDRVQVPTTGMSVSAGTIALWGRLVGTQSFVRYFFGHTTGSSPANWENSIQLYMDNGDNNLDLGFGGVHPKHANIMTLSANTWYHIALTWDGTNYVVYVDGIEKASGTYTGLSTLNSIADIGNDGNTGSRIETFQGLLDEVRIYDGALSKYDIAELAGITIASSPSPADEATGVSTTVDLSWSAGYYAASTNGHDVYLGTNYNSVADANHSSAEFKGNQSSTTYDPGTLSASTIYYWSIDEVNDTNTWAGDVWSFTTAGGDTTAPSPDPMTWATEPYATGASSISMTATTATDASGVEYYFDCTAGGGSDSGWQDSTTYEDTGLSELTEYTYRVKARDKSANQNETAYSTTKSATTQDGTAPSPDPMTWATDPYATGTSSISMTATTATDTSGVEYYFDCTAGGGSDSGWQDSTTYEDTGLSELTEYTYRVKARDKSSNQNETAYSTTKSATTEDGTAPSPDPMTWATEPYATGVSSISMTATTATDTSGVEYSFDCTAGGGNDSGWQDSATYEDTGLSASTQYTYRVQARDKSSNQNATGWSTTKSATTDAAGGEPNLVSWWKLDESSGATADDSSGNNHDGTRTGGSWAPTGGKFDGAVDIGDANSDRVQVPTTGMSVSAGTIALWGRIVGTQSFVRYFFGHTTGSSLDNWENSIQLYMDNGDNNLDLGFGGVHPKHANIMTLSANTWYHIALTWDGTNYVVYVDGVSKASGTYTGLSTLNSIADIGNDGNTGSRIEAFQGLLDEVRIYDGALSKYDIADLAGITIASNPSPADEATGVSTTVDLSWSAGYYAASTNGHDVYFGTNYNAVADANHSSSEFKGTQSSTTYDPGTMSADTTYYWAIDEVNDSNTWIGDVWSFTTEGAAAADVELVGSWVAGTSHSAESGNDRVLVLTAHAEDDDSAMSITSVTYGGKSMTKVIEQNTAASGYHAYVGAFILNEADVNDASGSSFVVTWQSTPLQTPNYGSAFFANVKQSDPNEAEAGNYNTSNDTVSTSALGTNDGDMVIVAATCGNSGSYGVNNGFTKGVELTITSADGVTGHKAASGSNETPSVTFTSGANRQAILGFVLNKTD